MVPHCSFDASFIYPIFNVYSNFSCSSLKLSNLLVLVFRRPNRSQLKYWIFKNSTIENYDSRVVLTRWLSILRLLATGAGSNCSANTCANHLTTTTYNNWCSHIESNPARLIDELGQKYPQAFMLIWKPFQTFESNTGGSCSSSRKRFNSSHNWVRKSDITLH